MLSTIFDKLNAKTAKESRSLTAIADDMLVLLKECINAGFTEQQLSEAMLEQDIPSEKLVFGQSFALGEYECSVAGGADCCWLHCKAYASNSELYEQAGLQREDLLQFAGEDARGDFPEHASIEQLSKSVAFIRQALAHKEQTKCYVAKNR